MGRGHLELCFNEVICVAILGWWHCKISFYESFQPVRTYAAARVAILYFIDTGP